MKSGCDLGKEAPITTRGQTCSFGARLSYARYGKMIYLIGLVDV